MMLWDGLCDCWRWLGRVPEPAGYDYCPSVTVVIAGYNEADTIAATLASVWGSYPRLQIVVVDDGSEDGTGDVAQAFAHAHEEVLVLRRPERGGKPSACNVGLNYAEGEVIVFVDADSHLGPSALWEIVQPLKDPHIGGVSATVLARNAFTNLITWFQAYEYLNTIFVGRRLMARLGILSIISGAFGAYRREIIERCGGADVELAEDMDLALRTRKAGYQIAFAPRAQCFTNVPATWGALFRQRTRWEESGIVRLLCRKHIDIAYWPRENFSWLNFLTLAEAWLFNVFCVVGIWAYAVWCLLTLRAEEVGMLLLTVYLCYVVFEAVQVLAVLFYSTDWRRDALACAVAPLAPCYQLFLFVARSRALVGELLIRESYENNHIPERVRNATWRW